MLIYFGLHCYIFKRGSGYSKANLDLKKTCLIKEAQSDSQIVQRSLKVHFTWKLNKDRVGWQKKYNIYNHIKN